jgi:hypothetical protein
MLQRSEVLLGRSGADPQRSEAVRPSIGSRSSTDRKRSSLDRRSFLHRSEHTRPSIVPVPTSIRTHGFLDRARSSLDSSRVRARRRSFFLLCRDTRDLYAVLAALGPSWRAIYSEPLDDPGANDERACFLFDTRFVTHTGLVSVLHQKRRRVGDEYMTPHWWRAPKQPVDYGPRPVVVRARSAEARPEERAEPSLLGEHAPEGRNEGGRDAAAIGRRE